MPLFDLKITAPISSFTSYFTLCSIIGTERKVIKSRRKKTQFYFDNEMGFYPEGITFYGATDSKAIIEIEYRAQAFDQYQIKGEFINPLDIFKLINFLKVLAKTGEIATFNATLRNYGFSQDAGEGATISHKTKWVTVEPATEIIPDISRDGIILPADRIIAIRNLLNIMVNKEKSVPVMLDTKQQTISLGIEKQQIIINSKTPLPADLADLWQKDVLAKNTIPPIPEFPEIIEFSIPPYSSSLLMDIIDHLTGKKSKAKKKKSESVFEFDGTLYLGIGKAGNDVYLYFNAISPNFSIHLWLPIAGKELEEEEYP